MELSPAAERFWRDYLSTLDRPATAESWFHGVSRLGTTPEGADDGALLVERGLKTATCALRWEYEAEHRPLPQVGSLSLLENGRDEPVCILKTTQVVTRPYREVDGRFAYDYGGWNRSLKTWRLECWPLFADVCARLGREPALDMPVVCERFRVVYPESGG
jgi:uncharacterized protein YhfF